MSYKYFWAGVIGVILGQLLGEFLKGFIKGIKKHKKQSIIAKKSFDEMTEKEIDIALERLI